MFTQLIDETDHSHSKMFYVPYSTGWRGRKDSRGRPNRLQKIFSVSICVPETLMTLPCLSFLFNYIVLSQSTRPARK